MEKLNKAIVRLQEFEPLEGYYLAFSGGKDSVVLKDITIKSGVKFDAHYSLTTIDPPELVQFIRKYHPEVLFEKPKKPFLKMLETRGFPIRQRRWCCAEYKENGGVDRTVLTGIRWQESPKRAKRSYIETCYKRKKDFVHPIIDWTTKEIWEYIHDNELKYCSLYDKGFKRIGCLFCPMLYWKRRVKETERYPKQTEAFIRAFEKLYKNRKRAGSKSVDRWASGKEMFWYWVSENKVPMPKQGN